MCWQIMSTSSLVLNGPYPTETAEETAARQQYEARAQFEAEIVRSSRKRPCASVIPTS